MPPATEMPDPAAMAMLPESQGFEYVALGTGPSTPPDLAVHRVGVVTPSLRRKVAASMALAQMAGLSAWISKCGQPAEALQLEVLSKVDASKEIGACRRTTSSSPMGSMSVSTTRRSTPLCGRHTCPRTSSRVGWGTTSRVGPRHQDDDTVRRRG